MRGRLHKGDAHQNKTNTKRYKKHGTFHHIHVVLLLSVMGLMYLAQINKTNAFTYPINELQTRKDSLVAEQQQLKVEAARLGSLDTVKNSTVAQNLVSPSQTQTIQ